MEFVEGGKGFIPIHCASYCFLNSPKYIALVGAQFRRHGTGTFESPQREPDHPVMKGFKGFESWDETYVHTKHNEKAGRCSKIARKARRQGAVDVGPHARKRARVLHRVGPRSSHLGQQGFQELDRARHSLADRK